MVSYNPNYTEAQIAQYFDRICLPSDRRKFNVAELSPEEQLSFLTLLYKHHLVKIPWENVDQHYSIHGQIIISYPYLFKKIVSGQYSNGRGGYCLENNSFLFAILYSLGFSVYTGGARIYHNVSKTYFGFCHIVNLVTIGGTKYLLDTGYGACVTTTPLPLIEGEVRPQIEPAQMRLIHESPGGYAGPNGQRMWIYQHRVSPEAPWLIHYAFTELEFTYNDIKMVNMFPATSKHVFFSYMVMCVRLTTTKELDCSGTGDVGEKELEGEIDGAMILSNNIVKWRRKGKKVMEKTVKTEEERLDALKTYFGIEVDAEDAAAIVGSAAHLTDTPGMGGHWEGGAPGAKETSLLSGIEGTAQQAMS